MKIANKKGFNRDYEIINDYVVLHIKRKIDGVRVDGYFDLEDLERVKDWNLSWCATWDEEIQNYYMKASEYLGIVDGKPKYHIHLFHMDIMNVNGGKVKVDHRNHNTMDNRKFNLRVTDNPKNGLNRKSKNKNNTTGYRNVILDKDTEKYIIMLCINNIRFRVGKLYEDVHEAGRDAEKYRKEYYKEFAGKS